MGSVAQDKYIHYDAKGVEVIEPGEEELKKVIAGQFNDMQRMAFKQIHHGMRATHVKTQGCIKGKMIVPELPPHLAQGLFAKPGTYDVVARYSSLTPKMASDVDHAPRGFAFKVFGAEGEKLWGNENTQDFTFNNYPSIELRTMKGTHALADSLVRNFEDLSKFGEEMAQREDKDVAMAPALIPKHRHMTVMRQYSQGAIRYGDYVAKIGCFPKGETQLAFETDYIKPDDEIDVLSALLKEDHAKHTITYSICAQLLENLQEQSVEDLGYAWDEKKYPFQEIAVLEFPPQDSFDHAFRTWFDDSGVACNPWHGLVTHRPLGSAMRSRRTVYAESRKMRLKMNGLTDYKEPKTVADVPIGPQPQSIKASA